MEAIRQQLNKPWVIGIIAFIIGAIFGLVVLGWGPLRVQYYDAAPTNLRADLQEQYMRMAIDSYSATGDPVAAKQRFDDLGSSAPQILDKIQANSGVEKPEAIAAFRSVVLAGAAGTPVAPGAVTAAVPTPTPTPAAAGGSFVRTILPIMCGLTLLLALALVGIFFLRGRGRGTAPVTAIPAAKGPEAGQEAEWANYQASGEEPPMAQFMASYKLGDDLFDDSFSIDSPGGEFLGECGVGISETIGVGDPKKVTAFEVWLFDKNDIQTVTKVLMSNHAFADETIRQRLAAKGEPVVATPGSQVVLETASLQLVARVVDMSYGEGALPPESFFDNLVLDLAVWQK